MKVAFSCIFSSNSPITSKPRFRMNFLRIARATARFIPTATRPNLQSRGYADAVSDKIQLTLALPHQVPTSPDLTTLPILQRSFPLSLADSFLIYSLFTNLQMCMWQSHGTERGICHDTSRLIYTMMNRVQVNLPAESGEMGVLANHVPTIEQLKPGLVEIIEESGGSKTFFRM